MGLEALQAVYGPTRNRIVSAELTDTALVIHLHDGRAVHVPLAWLPAVAAATPEQRQAFHMSPMNVLWHDLDDGISLEQILLGRFGDA